MRRRPWRGRALLPIFSPMKGLRRRGADGHGIETRIRDVLRNITPLLRIEHCSLELGGFDADSGELTVGINGTCPDCVGSPAMFATAIEAHVKQRVPEVRRVIVAELL